MKLFILTLTLALVSISNCQASDIVYVKAEVMDARVKDVSPKEVCVSINDVKCTEFNGRKSCVEVETEPVCYANDEHNAFHVIVTSEPIVR